jgi:ring-1,2-phenylacetyl-CoA epoxidase subunit PaaE
MAGARELLHEREIPAARVHSESFIAPHLRAEAQAQLHRQTLTIIAAGRETGLVVEPGQTVLEAGLAVGLALPYSCAMGGCGACKLELERGEVIMREPNCLTERERERGMVLACIANPIHPCRLRVPTGEAKQ